MRITLIAAMAANRVIGKDGKLPWHITDDLKRFKRLTMGKTLIMGRKTWEEIGCKPLPGRRCIVISRNTVKGEGAFQHALSLEEALKIADDQSSEEVMVIGGGQVYEEALPKATRMYLTLIYTMPKGDTHFPEIDWSEWNVWDRRKVEGLEFNLQYINADRA